MWLKSGTAHQKHNHRPHKVHTQPQVQLLNCVILPPCHSLRLICNNWPSSSTRTQMDSYIDYTQSKKRKRKKENPAVQHKTQPPPPSLLPDITHCVIPVMYLCTPPSEEYAIDLPSVCMFLCTLVCVSVCVRGPDSSEPLFLHAGAAPIGFVRGSHIWAVLEIHQA